MVDFFKTKFSEEPNIGLIIDLCLDFGNGRAMFTKLPESFADQKCCHAGATMLRLDQQVKHSSRVDPPMRGERLHIPKCNFPALLIG